MFFGKKKAAAREPRQFMDGSGPAGNSRRTLPMTTIPSLPRATRGYLRAFDLRAVSVSCHGQVRATVDPTGAAMAWWCTAKQARRVAVEAQRNGGDIPAAGQTLQVPLTPHSAVVQRAAQAVARIEAGLTSAQGRGALAFFNAEFRRRRLAAAAAGKGFMSYDVALARLRQAIAGAIAAGGNIEAALVFQVFK
jgi:hypothetical protein